MKLKFHFIMMAVAILMAGCSDDDEPVYGAEDIAGTYKGTLDVSVSGNKLSEEDDFTLTIKAQKNGKVEISMADFGTENMNLTGIVIPDIEVSAADGRYTLKGAINTTSGTSPITGSMEGTIIDGKADFIFNFRPGGMPMDIVATFTM